MLLESVCPVCHRYSRIIHGHHIIPRREGGEYSWKNIVWLCPKCHGKAEAGKISTISLQALARERRIIEKLIEPDELDEPFETEVRYILSYLVESGERIHELCAFYNDNCQFSIFPPSIYGPRFYPQTMISLWLGGMMSSSKLLEIIAQSRVQIPASFPEQ